MQRALYVGYVRQRNRVNGCIWWMTRIVSWLLCVQEEPCFPECWPGDLQMPLTLLVEPMKMCRTNGSQCCMVTVFVLCRRCFVSSMCLDSNSSLSRCCLMLLVQAPQPPSRVSYRPSLSDGDWPFATQGAQKVRNVSGSLLRTLVV